MQAHEARAFAQRFFTPDNARSYDSLVHFATFGRDRAWKDQVLRALDQSEEVLELASGTGILSGILIDAGKTVVGLDLTLDYLYALKKKRDILVAQATAEALPYRRDQFDAVVSSYLAKYVDVESLAQECIEVLRPGGVAVFHDFTRPPSRVIRVFWKMHFLLLQFCGVFIPEWKTVFSELQNVIVKSEWESRLVAALKQAGFVSISKKYHTAGTAAIIAAEKP